MSRPTGRTKAQGAAVARVKSRQTSVRAAAGADESPTDAPSPPKAARTEFDPPFRPPSDRRYGQKRDSTVLREQIREAFLTIAEGSIDDFKAWMAEIQDPARKCDIFLRAAAYAVPLMTRAEVTGKDGGPVAMSQERERLTNEIFSALAAGAKPPAQDDPKH